MHARQGFLVAPRNSRNSLPVILSSSSSWFRLVLPHPCASRSPLFVSTFELSELPTLAGEASLPRFGGLTVGVAAFRRVGRPARPCEVPEVRRAADFRLRVGRSAQPRPPQAFGRSAQPRARRWHVLRHGAAHRRRAPGVGARSPPARRSLGRPAPETQARPKAAAARPRRRPCRYVPGVGHAGKRSDLPGGRGEAQA